MTIEFPEHRAPCGRLDTLAWSYNTYFGHARPPGDLSRCLATRIEGRPWLLTIWEPLATKAPSPALSSPWCCYLNTVIFYHRPHIVSPWVKLFWSDGKLLRNARPGGFEEWGQVKTLLRWNDVVRFEGEDFELTGGTVVWKHRRWWMRHGARRLKKAEAR